MIHAAKTQCLMKAALKKCAAHAAPLSLLMLCQLLIRLIALAPAVLGFIGIAEGMIPGWLYYALSAVLYVFMVMPARFRGGQWLWYFAGEGLEKPIEGIPYGKRLKMGLLRLAKGLPWGIPIYCVLGYLVIGSAVLPYNQMWRPVQNLAPIFGMEATLLGGIIAFIPGLLIMILIFCFGWLLNMPAEYRMDDGAIRWGGSMKKEKLGLLLKNFRANPLLFLPAQAEEKLGLLLKNFGVNTLLFLPALAGVLAVIIPYIFSNVDFSGSVLKTIRDMTKLMDQPLPLEVAGALLLIFFVLYLPLCAVRKMRNALISHQMPGGKYAAG